MEEGMRELVEVGDDLTGAAGIRAIGARVNGVEQYFRLLQKAGRVPSESRQWRTERDIARVAEVVLDVFDRYGFPSRRGGKSDSTLTEEGGRRRRSDPPEGYGETWGCTKIVDKPSAWLPCGSADASLGSGTRSNIRTSSRRDSGS